MIDHYTKLVLTIIAVALIALVGERALSPAAAQPADCGSIEKPCYVAVGYITVGNKYSPCYAGAPCSQK
jgi:hypothetical protein